MPRLGAHLSIAGGLPRAVDRAVASRCEALQIFTKSVGQWRARVLPPDEIVLFRRRVARDRHSAGRRAQQLSDQHRGRRARAAGAVARRRWAKSSIAPTRSGWTGSSMHPGSFTTGTRGRGAATHCRGPSCAAASAAVAAQPLDPARAHRRAGHQPRPPLRASRGHPRACSTARRASASASTPATCSRPATTSAPTTAIARPSTSSIGSSASIASRRFT